MSLSILDTQYAHQGHQYEFFKLPYDFYLCESRHPSRSPIWGPGRPLRDNVSICSLSKAARIMRESGKAIDVIIHRVGSRPYHYKGFVKRGKKVIAVMQTTTAYKIPYFVTDVVWNSEEVMHYQKKNTRGVKHHYIPHGFDPKEFRPIDISKEKDVMMIANDFLERNEFLNYKLWHDMKLSTGLKFDIWGHQRIYKPKYIKIYNKQLGALNLSDKDIDKKIRQSDDIYSLISAYNSYKVYFNTTSSSAMPRGRGEAMMCGTPIVTTDNFDISNYLKHKEDCILSNDFNVLKKGILDIVNDEGCREYYSEAARRAAIKHFGINDYIKRWIEVIEG